MRYNDYSKTQLEANANALNQKFDKERLEKVKPIDVYDVLEFVGAEVDWKYLSNDKSVLGATVFCNGILPVYEHENGILIQKNIRVEAGTIVIDIEVDSDSNIGRKNFTVMHEVFHYLYHKKSFTKRNGGLKKVLETDINRSYEEKRKGMTAMEILEWQANYMAAAFLVPKNALLNEMDKINFIPRIDVNNIVPIHIDLLIIKELANKFSVSCQTMIYRMQSLNILRK